MQIIFVSIPLLIQSKKEQDKVAKFLKDYPGFIDDVTSLPLEVKEKIE